VLAAQVDRLGEGEQVDGGNLADQPVDRAGVVRGDGAPADRFPVPREPTRGPAY
jgi:hypothetical protein